MKPRLIALYSPAPQSGKSTVAELLCRKHGYQQISFAGPLKEMTDKFLELHGFDEGTRARMLYGDLKEKPLPEIANRTPRHLMQTLGTEWCRVHVGDSVWVDLAVRRAAMSARPVVIDDLRFPNELIAIRDADGLCVKVTRPSATRVSNHVSEGQLDGSAYEPYWDDHISNDGSLADLERAVDLLIQVGG